MYLRLGTTPHLFFKGEMEEEKKNYIVITHSVLQANEHLRDVFRKRWEDLYGKQWSASKEGVYASNPHKPPSLIQDHALSSI